VERSFRRLFEDKGAAQAKRELNGKAQPFLTTGGEAVPKENLGKKENKKLLKQVSGKMASEKCQMIYDQ